MFRKRKAMKAHVVNETKSVIVLFSQSEDMASFAVHKYPENALFWSQLGKVRPDLLFL